MGRRSMTEEDLKDENRTRVTQKTVAERTWYTPEAWEHGGLRIKNEVKDEAGMDTSESTHPRGSRRKPQSKASMSLLLYASDAQYCIRGYYYISLFTSVVCWVQFGVFSCI